MEGMTPRQAERLRRAHAEITSVLTELGVLDGSPLPSTSRQQADQARRWRMLNAVALRGGQVGASEWGRLGLANGYDPRGLGGFFRGADPAMEHRGHRRVLTATGRRYVERWREDFEHTEDTSAPPRGSSSLPRDTPLPASLPDPPSPSAPPPGRAGTAPNGAPPAWLAATRAERIAAGRGRRPVSANGRRAEPDARG